MRDLSGFADRRRWSGAAGGVGAAAVELGKAMGAQVTAAASTNDKVQFALDLGADNGLIYPAGAMDKAAQTVPGARGGREPGVWDAELSGELASMQWLKMNTALRARPGAWGPPRSSWARPWGRR
ncbi:hypothetical protein HZ989_03405 [Brevundimonas sp. AJA228-03]|uniref:hypothetical protein n=1 Tax=Brevundimonas sp. AJA228-03 TaxID=2752515 RepID=UPI001BB759B1|nr:hypothetical protein HZ989_03405 [Brevundimonas sp. AJA228-03]